MKILFLDIDGVLNNKKYNEKVQSGNAIDPRCVLYLNQIIRETKCNVVVSSSWRLYHTWFELLSILADAGVNTTTFIGSTPDLFRHFLNRGDEILNWIINNVSEEYTFVVLDDTIDGMDKVEKNLVLTSFKGDGLNAEKAQQAIQLLNNK